MAAISDIDPYNCLHEKSNHDIQSSSSDKSDVVGNEQDAIPAKVKESDTFDEASSSSIDEVFDVKSFDPVLARKMALVNTAIDEMGMTSFQWKLLFLNGFGYAVDSVC